MVSPRLALFAGLFLVLALQSVDVNGHGHDHGHSHDHDHVEPNPSFKYSRAANEDPIINEDDIPDEEIVDLPPQKPKAGGHGHSHNDHDHGHAHNHGHAHAGGGGCGHSHGGGGSQKDHSPEEREEMRKKLHENWDEDDEEIPDRSVWFQAISATLLISAAPFFILFFIPLDNTTEKQWLLKIVLSFASGGLLGDAFLHLIPHAASAVEGEAGHGHSHSHGHSHGDAGGGHDMTVGLGVVSGIVAFLCVEKMVRIFNGSGGHGHSHGAAAPAVKKSEKKKEEKKEKDKKSDGEEEKEKNKDKDEKKKKDDKEETSKVVEECSDSEVGEVKVAGYLNLFADTFHNFTDGLAIGASFIAGEGVGKITTLTILLHEVPHEVGDYAILIQSGMKPMKAIMMQLVTAVGALTGCVVSLVAPRVGEAAASTYILPFTAGGFIYIATVSVIPELLVSVKWKQSILEVIALLAGVGMMVIIAQYE